MEQPGLRARKKQETHEAIAEAALAMMVERGFDDVSVAEIAEVAHVSKVTVFNYFPTKEDIVLARIEDHTAGTADAVRDRPSGTSPLDAIQTHFTRLITAKDPITGLSDRPDVIAFGRLILETPALLAKFAEQRTREQDQLAASLRQALGKGADSLTCHLAALQIVSVLWALAERNLRATVSGTHPRVVARNAVKDSQTAFVLLARGVGDLMPAPTKG
ncbi:MAG: TetR/AcrR family transcriptional regulator [Humibacillus sp.]|nr:TetR/AcrR family transcriptional regulator [Humibacillus sp.]MDN5778578.1 TetR/AcrR family transcriptional regulator [Humibacillus sp.]